MYETSGKIKMIGEVQSFASGFTKREFVVTTAADKYPQDIKFDMVKEKCAMLDSFKPGDDVQVNFDIRGREYNGKYFVDLSCWKLQPADGGSDAGAGPSRSAQGAPRAAASPSAEPSMNDLRDEDDFDDVPF
ncbi:MAG: DUF3127 domain-containing protein [Luteolibacter sp.]|uniref:DUF3127 domain-containing protein n=1 Tax=Luteolibacter sp. TaxID=1962973 RepID=UPI0032639836